MRIAAILLGIIAFVCSPLVGAEPKVRVSLELLTSKGLNITASQQWSRALQDMGFTGLTIRAIAPGEEMKVTSIGSDAAPHFKVTGILSSDNRLNVPGGKFATSDVAKLRKWLDTLRDHGPDAVTQPAGPFGLSPRQLDDVLKDFRRGVPFKTTDLKASEAVAKIARLLSAPVEVDPLATRDLSAVTVADELQGVACGTALAAIVRPGGLAVLPERVAGGGLRYRIAKAIANSSAWPVGTTPKGRPAELLPALFEPLNVEIKDISLTEALDAIRERLAVPFLFDHNAMALHGVDPTQVTSDVDSKRLSYSQILNRILMQGRLKYELRADDDDQLFLWITTVKPAS